MRPRLTAQPFPHIAIGQQTRQPVPSQRAGSRAPRRRTSAGRLSCRWYKGDSFADQAAVLLGGQLLARPLASAAGVRSRKGQGASKGTPFSTAALLKDGLCFSRDRRHHVAVPLISDHYNAITWPAAPLQRDDKADRRVEPVLIALLGRAWRHRYQPTEAHPSTPLSVPPINGLSRRFASTPNSNFTPSPPNAARLYPAGSPGRTPRSRSRPAAFRRSDPPTGRRSADRASSRAGGRSSPSRADRRRYRSRYLPNGQAWLLFGADSGFEARTEIYFTRAAVTFTPM